MLFTVTVIPCAKKTAVTATAPGHYRVRVTAAPAKGQANRELIRVLADYFGTAPSSITIKRGMHSRNKLIEISE
jgi:uncharacterized protein (TIGR00251 family)